MAQGRLAGKISAKSCGFLQWMEFATEQTLSIDEGHKRELKAPVSGRCDENFTVEQYFQSQ